MRDTAHVRPEVFVHGDCGLFEGFEQFLLDLFLLAVAADEVAEELAGSTVGAALDAGFDVGAEGFGERDVHAGLRHGIRMADIGSFCQRTRNRLIRRLCGVLRGNNSSFARMVHLSIV